MSNETPEPEPADPPEDTTTVEMTPRDVAEFESWKADQANRRAADGAPPDGDGVVRQIVINVGGEDRFYRLAESADEVRAYLGALVTFAENAQERAVAIFEAALDPDEFERLQRDIRPMMREVRRAYAKDPAGSLSVAETWQAMADGVVSALQEMLGDPKGDASAGGRSRTGPSSSTGSVRSALPSTT